MRGTAGHSGFSLIELLIVVSIIDIIASIAIPRFAESKAAAAKSDIRNVMTAMEQYSVRFGTYPSAVGDLAQVGYAPTADVTFSKFKLETKNGAQTVHMHVGHSDSGNEWHANYPSEGMEIEIR
jgi:prepilin-type N-terminal cleavage/methylation domain-containing protein